MKQNAPYSVKKLPPLFYILLLILSVAVLGMMIVWIKTKNDVVLGLVLALFAVYLIHLVFGLTRGKKRQRTLTEELNSFINVLHIENCRVVYITYLSDARHIRTPSEHGRDYLIELYPEMENEECLKRHLWYDLPESEENRLNALRYSSYRVPKPFLNEIVGKRVYIQAAFFDVASGLEDYRSLFSGNQIVLYGEETTGEKKENP